MAAAATRTAAQRLTGPHVEPHLIYPEFEVSFSVSIRTLRQQADDGGEAKMESKASAVIRKLRENKRAGKLTLNMLPLKSLDFLDIARYFHKRCLDPSYLAITRVSFSGVSVKKKLMTVIADELLSRSSYRHLKWLSLTQCSLSDATCAILANKGLLLNDSLAYLYLSKNPRIGAKGFESILNGISSHASMDSLWFNSNPLTLAHADSLSDFFESDSNLKWIRLESTGMNDEMFGRICKGLEKNSHLQGLIVPLNHLKDVRPIANVLKSPISGLTLIDLARNEFGEETGAILGEGIAESAIIQSIDLSMNSLTDRGVNELSQLALKNESLWRLRLAACGLTDEACVGLSALLGTHCNLQILNLAVNSDLTGKGIQILKEGISTNHHLRSLNLSAMPLLGKLGGEALKEGCLAQVRGTMELIETTRKVIEDMGKVYKDLANRIVEFVGYRCIDSILLGGSFKELHTPGIDDLIMMRAILEKEHEHVVELSW